MQPLDQELTKHYSVSLKPLKGCKKTHNLTHKRQIDLIDASSEDPKCQPCVKEEVEECVPAISADSNHAV